MTKVCSNLNTVSRKSVKQHMEDRREIENYIIVKLTKISEKEKTKSRERKVFLHGGIKMSMIENSFLERAQSRTLRDISKS